MRLLAISGSLRDKSSNTSALQAAVILAPPEVEVVLYTDLGKLPHFNPDLDTDRPPEYVSALRQKIACCDGLIICSPEYAHGIAGTMKNALDWLVSSVEFPQKPVALINTSQRAVHSEAQLREILKTMSARVVDEASITLPLLGQKLDAASITAHPDFSVQLQSALAYFMAAIRARATTDN